MKEGKVKEGRKGARCEYHGVVVVECIDSLPLIVMVGKKEGREEGCEEGRKKG